MDVKQAVEDLFDVKVAKVRTQTRKGKTSSLSFPLRPHIGLEEGDCAAARRSSHRLLLRHNFYYVVHCELLTD